MKERKEGSMHGVAPYPLYWPLEHARTAVRRSALFKVDFATARDTLTRELHLLKARDVLISSNIPIRKDGLPVVPDREPADPGVAVYFTRSVGAEDRPFVLACDQFTQVRWNLRAIQATLEALRAIERYGTTSMMERAFSGFAQLPPKRAAGETPWRAVMGMPEGPCDVGQLQARYRELAREHHPDVAGGDSARMARINDAYERGKKELGA
jgi:hypothetical protein